MTPTIPCFSFVFKREPKEFDMTYYIHSKQQVFSPFILMPIPSEFGIKPFLPSGVNKFKGQITLKLFWFIPLTSIQICKISKYFYRVAIKHS
jgi:hypothetical protein